MKKIYFLAVTLLGLSLSGQVLINDDFESYSNGAYYGGHWSNWSQSASASSESIIVTDAQASTGSKSGAINTDGQDAILVIPPVSEGVYTFQWDMLVPQDKSAWIGFMEDATALGDDSMPLKVNFNTNTDIGGTNYDNKMYLSLYADAGTVSLSDPIDYPIGEWATYKFKIDLDFLLVTFYINGTEVLTTNYTAPNLKFGGADMWKFDTGNIFITGSTSTMDACEYYVDNVIFAEGVLAVNDVQNSSPIAVYPTVATDVVNVVSKANLSEVALFNMNGQQVSKMVVNGTTAQVNVSTLPAGVYVLKTVAGKEVKSTKIVVK